MKFPVTHIRFLYIIDVQFTGFVVQDSLHNYFVESGLFRSKHFASLKRNSMVPEWLSCCNDSLLKLNDRNQTRVVCVGYIAAPDTVTDEILRLDRLRLDHLLRFC